MQSARPAAASRPAIALHEGWLAKADEG